MKLDKLMRSDTVDALRKANVERSTVPTPSTETLRKRAIDAEFRKRDPYGAGATDAPPRRQELGEIAISLDTPNGPFDGRIQVSHGDGELNLHGVSFLTAEIDRDLTDAFEFAAANLNRVQGTAKQAVQATIVGSLLDAVFRRHKFVADAVARQLAQARYGV